MSCFRACRLWQIRSAASSFRQLSAISSSTSGSSQNEVSLERLTDESSGIAVLSLNRPQAKNAISRSLLAGMRQVLDQVRHDRSVRVLIVRSSVPGVFCAGADLKERARMKPAEVEPFVSSARAALAELRDLPMPCLAALDGLALGGGLEMALACDLRVAASAAKLGLVETRLAILPGAGGTQLLPRLIGPSRAKQLMFSGETVDGLEAHRIGLVDHVVEQNPQSDAAFRRAVQLGRRIVPNGPLAVRMVKAAVNHGLEVNLATGLAIEQACYAQLIPTQDRVEGLTAFKEKRPPVYTGE